MEVWLTYWIVMGCVMAVESTVEWTFNWFPFYYHFKTLLLLWLTLPQIQGSTYIYVAHIEPFLTAHEGEIDRAIADSRVKARQIGLDYLNRLVQRLRAAVVGTLAPQMGDAVNNAARQDGVLPAQPMNHPPTMGDPASTATAQLYSLAGNVFRQYGPAAVAAGAALLHPMETVSGSRSDASTSSNKKDGAKGLGVAESSGTKGSRSSRRAQLEAELAALDSPQQTQSTISSPSSYNTSSNPSSPPYQPRNAPRSASAGNPTTLASRPSSTSSTLSENATLRGDKFEKIGRDELGDFDGRGREEVETPNGSKKASWYWWNKDGVDVPQKSKDV